MKYAAKVEYFGLNYAGFQRQKNDKSIQGELETTLSSLLNQEILIHGAGRTDAGVSASGQVISFSCNKDISDLEDFRFHWNCVLPPDISISKMAAVAESFDARHSCVGKRYRYVFSIGEKHPLNYGRVAYLGKRSFDEEQFESALHLFEGKHRFHNFTTKKEDKDAFVRDLAPIIMTRENDVYTVILRSNGFMTYQIRFMVGAALKAAFHAITLDEIQRRLDEPNRDILPYKAPAEGLVLEEVIYEFDVFA